MVAPGGWGACMVARGACMVDPGGGHVWLIRGMCGCSKGSVHGCSRGWGVLVGMPGCSGGAWFLPGGACMVALGVCVGYHEIRRYGQ